MFPGLHRLERAQKYKAVTWRDLPSRIELARRRGSPYGIIDAMPFRFVDDGNPTDEEIRQWAYGDAVQPIEDFEVVVADLEHLPTLIELVGDSSCPARKYLLGSLYCLVGHCDLGDQRLQEGIAAAELIDDGWLRTWAWRARQVVEAPNTLDPDDWCGLQGLRTHPDGG